MKPANVLFKADGTPKLADFGLARSFAEDSNLTLDGEALGTPRYMAPEQAMGRQDLGPAVDVYALGAILYELLTGRPPFRGVSKLDTLYQVVHLPPVPVGRLQPGVPRDLAQASHALSRESAGGPLCLRWRSRRRSRTRLGIAAHSPQAV